jgi:hypothetical protein
VEPGLQKLDQEWTKAFKKKSECRSWKILGEKACLFKETETLQVSKNWKSFAQLAHGMLSIVI